MTQSINTIIIAGTMKTFIPIGRRLSIFDQSDGGWRFESQALAASVTGLPAAIIALNGRHWPDQHTVYPGANEELASTTSRSGGSKGA